LAPIRVVAALCFPGRISVQHPLGVLALMRVPI